ncbi:DUF4167 domain-containing protein [Aquamicrobium sp. LC103]|nr:DUF4167 domain-containing protein [Aquamicrobium sp. LC103]
MRPQQNRRMRGRGNNNNNNNNNRKGPNPLTRSYESNGPDVKIRGTAQQIAEKYGTLARDAQSSGDRVMAENYLQHAEHYNRIIMAAQAQQQVQQVRDARDEDDFDDERDDMEAQAGTGEQPAQRQNNGTGPQPVIEGTPAEVALEQGSIGGNEQKPAEAAPVNGADENAAEEPAPKRARRPRRPRVKAGEEASAEAGGQGSADEPVSEAAQ